MILKLGRPQPRQMEFIKDKHKFSAFGGARGGGKSWAVRHKAVLLCLKYPGIRVLIVRRTLPELKNNHVIYLTPALRGVATYNQNDKVYRFVNGSTITLGYFNSDNDANQYQGVQYDVIMLDEATQLKEEWIRKITACLRGVNDFPKQICYTCNPGGVSHNYIKRIFVDRKYQSGEREEDYGFIQSKVTDNEALMKASPDYIRQLEALPPKLRRAWLDGDWQIFDGMFFEEFRDLPEHYQDRQWTHVIEPFEVPKDWTIYRSFDFGYAKPFSCAWWAIDYDGRIYRILELYGCQRDKNGEDLPNEGVKWSPDKIFEEIARIEKEHRWLKGKKIIGIADPSIWDGSRGESVADMSAKAGVYWSKGINNRVAGWMQVHYRMAFDENGIPMMYIFRTCKGFIRTIPLLQFSQNNPEDLCTDDEDHIADEVRYLCMARPMQPVMAVEKAQRGWDPLADDTTYNQYSWVR